MWFHELSSSNKPFVQSLQKTGRIGIKYQMPLENEFSILESVLIDASSGENHVTVSALCPLHGHLLTNLCQVEPGSNGL